MPLATFNCTPDAPASLLLQLVKQNTPLALRDFAGKRIWIFAFFLTYGLHLSANLSVNYMKSRHFAKNLFWSLFGLKEIELLFEKVDSFNSRVDYSLRSMMENSSGLSLQLDFGQVAGFLEKVFDTCSFFSFEKSHASTLSRLSMIWQKWLLYGQSTLRVE